MVAEAVAAPTKWTSDSIRNALLDLSDKRNWTTNRLAAELEMSQVSLEAFLNGDVATIKLRNKGARLLERFGVEPPLTEPAPLRPRSAIAYLAEQPDQAEMEPEPAADPESEDVPDTDDIELVGIFNPHPFPMGFAVVWNTPPLVEPALRVSKTGILLNKALRDAMESPASVLLGYWQGDGHFRLAVALPNDRTNGMAIRIPKSGEIATRVRTLHIGPVVPDGTYPVEREGDCWITAAHPVATEAN